MNDERTQGALLLAVGGISLRLGLTDAALAYVKAGFRPILVAAGLVLVLLGGAAILRAARGPREAPEDGHDYGHAAHHPRVGWLLVLPLLALLLVAPPPLGSFAAQRQSDRPPVTSRSTFPPLPEPVEGVAPLTVTDFVFRALYDEGRSLEGVPVRLTGFVTPTPEGPGYRLTRFVLSCCAADGQAVHVRITGDARAWPEDTWIEAVGVWAPPPDHDPTVPSLDPPVLAARDVREIPAPPQPYEY